MECKKQIILKKDFHTLTSILQTTPGVYIYKNAEDRILYVGKAINIKRRVLQYFHASAHMEYKTHVLMMHVSSIEIIHTVSEFDALLLEAKLIHTYAPKYNILAKDDKSPLYIRIRNNTSVPKIEFVRLRQCARDTDVYGPFQSSKTARDLMRSIRTVIPFCTAKKWTGHACIYFQIGLCHPCPSVFMKLHDPSEQKRSLKEYSQNIHRIRLILSGKSERVKKQFYNRMIDDAKQHHFEDAAKMRDRINALERLHTKRYDPAAYMYKVQDIASELDEETKQMTSLLSQYDRRITSIHRIECYDISHLSGSHTVGSMVVAIDGVPDTGLYKRFRIRTSLNDDSASMKEMLLRRLTHREWTYPDLIIVDGGKNQIGSALHALTHVHINIPVIGIAKWDERIIIPSGHTFLTLKLSMDNSVLKIIRRIRDEAHRFANAYRKILLRKSFPSGLPPDISS